MNIEPPTVKSAYKLIKQHDQFIADRLLKNFRQSIDDMKLAVDRQREREAEYDASIWQRLTRNRADVLRPFGRAIEGAQTWYHNHENNLFRAADDLYNEDNSRRESEIESGNFVYYIVELDTNIRKTNDTIPVIYATRESAEYDCEGYGTVISIAEYNRRYGSFMED